MKAKFLSLKAHDFMKGLIVAVITAIITFLVDALQSGSTIDLELLKKIGITALIAMLSYLTKNLLTNSKEQFLKSE